MGSSFHDPDDLHSHIHALENEEDETSVDFTFTENDFYGHDVIDSAPIQIDDELAYLPEKDLHDVVQQSTTPSSPDSFPDWSDRLISDPNERIIFELDNAKKESWETLKDEIYHIRSTLPNLLPCRGNDDNSPPSLKEILLLVFGPSSDFATAFRNELAMDQVTFYKFLGTLALQMSYKETPSSLYDEYSLIKNHLLIQSKDEYINIWKKIATIRKAINSTGDGDYIGISCCPMCVWEVCEQAANKTVRTIAIANRTDDMCVSHDDDKIWCESSGENEKDSFKLRKVVHVKDNRRGIVSHTAVSPTTNLPLGFLFERNGDGAVECFKRIYLNLFPSVRPSSGSDLLPDLDGVSNHSDRGYTIWATVKDFLLPSGADFTNTVKK